MKEIKVTLPSTFKEKYQTFSASAFEIHISTHGVLVIRGKNQGRIVKAFSEGQWLTVEVE